MVAKSYLDQSEDPYERALEQILSRFDQFLRRMYREQHQIDKGLIVIADSHYRERLEVVARQLAAEGTQWGELRNIIDIPFFTLSKNSRLLQISDRDFQYLLTGDTSQETRYIKFDQDVSTEASWSFWNTTGYVSNDHVAR